MKPARETLPVTFVTRDGTTYAASFSERFVAGQRRPIWALGPIDVAKGKHSLVISLDSESEAKSYVSVADKAVESVTQGVGQGLAAEGDRLPARQAGADGRSVLGAQPNTYTQIAAVTMAELDTPAVGAPVRIVANPKLFEELGKQGRRIVLTHETTHVASTATASPVPLWLAEGFADYVAFTAVPVQDESAAKELFKAVRAGKVPATLPAPEAFAASATELPQAYESAWLACRLIAEREGQSKLVKFYRAVHASKTTSGLAGRVQVGAGDDRGGVRRRVAEVPREARRCLSRSQRWAPRAAAGVLAVALVLTIVVTTPWHLIDLPTPDASLDFTAAEIARQNAFRHELLPWSTTSWVLAVLVPLAIGFSPLGPRLYDAIRIRRWYVAVPLLVARTRTAHQPDHGPDRCDGRAGHPQVRAVGAGLGVVDP